MFARDADEQFFTANFDDHQPASISKMELLDYRKIARTRHGRNIFLEQLQDDS